MGAVRVSFNGKELILAPPPSAIASGPSDFRMSPLVCLWNCRTVSLSPELFDVAQPDVRLVQRSSPNPKLIASYC